MSNSDKAKGLFADLLDDEELEQIKKENETVKQEDSYERFIVYFIGDKPEVVWHYFINPKDGLEILDEQGKPTGKRKDYGTRYGYWTEDTDNKVSRHFVEVKTNNIINMKFEEFLEHPNFIPNKNCVKIYESEADFLVELI